MSKIVGNIVGNALDLSNLKTNGIADLSQNDPNGEGYVKNRTHWKEVNGVDIVAFPEATVELTSGNNMVNGFVKNSFIEGNKYKVIWNGTEYECICYVEDGTYLLGNSVYLGLTTEKDYPFCIGSYNGAVGFVGKGTETDETITLKIYSEQETIYHKLDKEYLPDDIGGGSAPDILLSDGVIIPETEVVLDKPWGSGTQSYIHSDLIPTVGETYGVFWNGTKYSCVAKQSGISDADVDIILGNGLSFGLPATEEPFCLRFYYAVAGDTQLTVVVASFDALEAVNLRVALPPMIDPKYIPNMYYTEERNDVEILAPSPAINPGSSMMGELYVQGNPITLVEGKTYKVTYNGVEYECVATAVDVNGVPSIALGDVGMLATGAPSGDYPFLLGTNAEIANMGLSAMILALDGASSITVSIVGYGEVVHKMPNEYLPDETYISFDMVNDLGLAPFNGGINGTRAEIDKLVYEKITNALKQNKTIKLCVSFTNVDTWMEKFEVLVKPIHTLSSSSNGILQFSVYDLPNYIVYFISLDFYTDQSVKYTCRPLNLKTT